MTSPKPGPLQLHAFRPEDAEALISWIPTEAALREFAGPGPRWPLDPRQLEQRLLVPGMHAWTARLGDDNEPVGHIERIRTTGIDRLDRVIIAPPWRRRGLAAGLVRCALAELPTTGAVDLLVFAGNAPAIRTYTSVGFTDAGAILPEYPDVHRMVLDPDHP